MANCTLDIQVMVGPRLTQTETTKMSRKGVKVPCGTKNEKWNRTVNKMVVLFTMTKKRKVKLKHQVKTKMEKCISMIMTPIYEFVVTQTLIVQP